MEAETSVLHLLPTEQFRLKDERRHELARLPIEEKFRMLEQMWEWAAAAKASREWKRRRIASRD